MGLYLGELADKRRSHPSDDMLSAFVSDSPDGQLTPLDIMTTSVLLLIAGHETTVNLITNGILTLLRHPDQLARLRGEPALMPGAVEELLRYEPPSRCSRSAHRWPISRSRASPSPRARPSS